MDINNIKLCMSQLSKLKKWNGGLSFHHLKAVLYKEVSHLCIEEQVVAKIALDKIVVK